MHVYIYDNYLSDKKYFNILSQIETRLTDLGLNGKIIRLDVMKNIQNAIDNEIKRGAKTLIAVGGDQILNKTINAVIKHEKNYGQSDIPVGVIPVETKNNPLSLALGMPGELEACDVLSARRIEKVDIGQAGASYFLAHAKIQNKNTKLLMEQGYEIEDQSAGEINIINLSIFKNLPEHIKPNPKDGILNLYIKSNSNSKFFNKKENASFFPLKKITVVNQKENLILDNSLQVSTPVEITILPKQISLIVGKERSF